MKTQALKSYFFEKNRCFIPRCKAVCCTNAPLPDGFLSKHSNKIMRYVYSAVNIGHNDYRDNFDSIIYNTTPSPIQLVGFDQYGNKLMGIPKEKMKELQIQSMEQVKELIKESEKYPNYCPFITEYARCNVYEERPVICREFGTLTDKLNVCPEKSSKSDVIKYFLKDICDFKGYYNFYKTAFINLFKKK